MFGFFVYICVKLNQNEKIRQRIAGEISTGT